MMHRWVLMIDAFVAFVWHCWVCVQIFMALTLSVARGTLRTLPAVCVMAEWQKN